MITVIKDHISNQKYNIFAVNFKQKIIEAINNIIDEEHQNIYRSFINKAQVCIEVERKQFENAL